MLFNSVAFAVFFVVVTTLYFGLPHRWRWGLLLAASCAFYMWFKPVYILILAFTIVVDYLAGIWIEQAQGPARKVALTTSLIANIGVLAVFKYWNFAQGSLTSLAERFGFDPHIPVLEMLLPIGLSFHTFQAMSYTIEVYRGAQRAERHFGIYSLYVMFYPQLVAGPIERPQNLLHQFRTHHRFDYARVTSGLRLMGWGLFKKVCVADRLVDLVNGVYAAPERFSGPWLALATAAFAVQIFCDFSGYSDMAIGAARVMGFTLMQNFNRPYDARSIADFWRRWHISLSTWFKDYVYVPLGGNRVGPARLYLNLMIVFLLSGLWHGANWTYVIWGALHGGYLIFAVATRSLRERWTAPAERIVGPFLTGCWQRSVVFVLVCIGWVFFRAADFSAAQKVFAGLRSGWGELAHPAALNAVLAHLGLGRRDVLLTLACLGVLAWVHHLQRQGPITPWLFARPRWQRWALYYGLAIAIFFLAPQTADQFIYFQF